MAGFLGNQPPKVPLTSADIADGTITNDDLAGSISNDKLAGSIANSKLATDPTNASNLASGTVPDARFPATLPAVSGANLTNLPGGGAWTLIGTQEASNSASLTQTGLDSTYDTYAIVFSQVHPTSDGATPNLRCGDSGGIDSGASDYRWHTVTSSTDGAGTYSAGASTGSSMMRLGGGIGNASGEGYSATVYLGRPGDGTMRPCFYGIQVVLDSSTATRGGILIGQRTSVITLDRVQILMDTGNIDSGRMSVYGISHT